VWKRRELREAMERTPKGRRDVMEKKIRIEAMNATACPKCGAGPRQPCLGVERRDGRRRPRKRLHAERWDAAGIEDRGARRNRRLQAAARLERERLDLEAMARLSELDGDASRTAPLFLSE
jgi:hypothetical protein